MRALVFCIHLCSYPISMNCSPIGSNSCWETISTLHWPQWTKEAVARHQTIPPKSAYISRFCFKNNVNISLNKENRVAMSHSDISIEKLPLEITYDILYTNASSQSSARKAKQRQLLYTQFVFEGSSVHAHFPTKLAKN